MSLVWTYLRSSATSLVYGTSVSEGGAPSVILPRMAAMGESTQANDMYHQRRCKPLEGGRVVLGFFMLHSAAKGRTVR